MGRDQLKALLEALTRAHVALTDKVSDEDLTITVALLELRTAQVKKELESRK